MGASLLALAKYIYYSILDTSSPKADDKQDGGQSVHHIAFDMFA